MAKPQLTLLALSLSLVWAGATAQSQDPKQDPAAEEPAAPAATAASESKAIASFKGGSITVADLENAIRDQSPFMRKRYTDKESLRALLDKTLRFELLAREAERQGFGDRDSVQQAVKQNAVQHLMRMEFDEKLSADTIPEADVEAYYKENIDEYVRPATRRASHIMVATLEEAKALLTELKGTDLRAFRARAREKSIDEATKPRGGDLRYFDSTGMLRGESEPSIPEALAKATFALKDTGDLSPKPIAVEGGFSVLMLTGQRDAVERKLGDKDLQQSIRVRLWRERRQDAIEAFVDTLREQHKPETHPELLSQIKLEAEPPVAKGPGVPEGFPHRKPGAARTAAADKAAGKTEAPSPGEDEQQE